MNSTQWNRREWLGGTVGVAAGAMFAAHASSAPDAPRRVAAINSIYRFRSHAYHIAGRFIHGYTLHGEHHQPPFQLARMYNHQSPPDDLGPEVCERHGIELCPSVAQALGGAESLDVDAVLIIIEHGDYPTNAFGQILYPRFEMFRQVVDVFRRSGRAVPVFVDKHLSYDHRSAATMVRTARDFPFGLMAGSSLPVTWRSPEIDPPLETPFTEGLVAFGYDRGPSEIYFFHALEALQVLLERRRGGETGIRSLRGLRGDDVWRAGDAGWWNTELLEAALRVNPSRNYGRAREQVKHPEAILIEYADGTRGAVLNLIEAVSDFSFAGRIEGRAEPLATAFVLPSPPGARFFDGLTWNIERFFTSGTPPYPIERTLLTSTVLDLGLRSMHDQGKPITSDALRITYAGVVDDGHMRGRISDAGA